MILEVGKNDPNLLNQFCKAQRMVYLFKTSFHGLLQWQNRDNMFAMTPRDKIFHADRITVPKCSVPSYAL